MLLINKLVLLYCKGLRLIFYYQNDNKNFTWKGFKMQQEALNNLIYQHQYNPIPWL